MIKSSPKSLPRFYCTASTDGCDNTIDIVSRTTNRVVVSVHYWYKEVEAKRSARKLARALEAIADEDVRIHISSLAEEQQQIAVVWGTEDILQVRPDLTETEAWKVLKECDRVHDCELGFNWLLIETVAEQLYPAPENDAADENDGGQHESR